VLEPVVEFAEKQDDLHGGGGRCHVTIGCLDFTHACGSTG
jgi:hypothetical protein